MNDDSQVPLFQNDLTPNIKMRFDSLCRSPSNINTSMLIEQIHAHIQQIHLALESNEFLDINAAQQGADLLIDLVNHLDDYSAEKQGFIIGAARYFILDEDNEPDTKSLLGFDDDIKVLNFVLRKLGKSTLEV